MTEDTHDTGRIADRLAISDVLHRHCRALDRSDSAQLQQCYWPEAQVDYGSYRGPAGPFAELVVQALTGNYELTRHCIGNTLLAFEGDQARSESYVDAGHLLPGGDREMRFGGRYLDLLERRDGQWRLLQRQVVMDWSRTAAIDDERDSDGFRDLAKGRNGSDDPLHGFLGGTI